MREKRTNEKQLVSHESLGHGRAGINYQIFPVQRKCPSHTRSSAADGRYLPHPGAFSLEGIEGIEGYVG